MLLDFLKIIWETFRFSFDFLEKPFFYFVNLAVFAYLFDKPLCLNLVDGFRRTIVIKYIVADSSDKKVFPCWQANESIYFLFKRKKKIRLFVVDFAVSIDYVTKLADIAISDAATSYYSLLK